MTSLFTSSNVVAMVGHAYPRFLPVPSTTLSQAMRRHLMFHCSLTEGLFQCTRVRHGGQPDETFYRRRGRQHRCRRPRTCTPRRRARAAARGAAARPPSGAPSPPSVLRRAPGRSPPTSPAPAPVRRRLKHDTADLDPRYGRVRPVAGAATGGASTKVASAPVCALSMVTPSTRDIYRKQCSLCLQGLLFVDGSNTSS